LKRLLEDMEDLGEARRSVSEYGDSEKIETQIARLDREVNGLTS